MAKNGDSTPEAGAVRSLTSTGITLLGVLLSIGITVGLGIPSRWWIRLAAGAAVVVLLGLAIKLGSSDHRGLIARLANWIVNSPG